MSELIRTFTKVEAMQARKGAVHFFEEEQEGKAILQDYANQGATYSRLYLKRIVIKAYLAVRDKQQHLLLGNQNSINIIEPLKMAIIQEILAKRGDYFSPFDCLEHYYTEEDFKDWDIV
jgi:hypothetical protein